MVSERGVVYLVKENTKESSSLAVGIGLELGVDLDDEGGGDCREQTGLYHVVRMSSFKRRRGTHEDQSCAQVFVVFLEEFLVVLFCHLVIVPIEPGPMALYRAGGLFPFRAVVPLSDV